MTKHILALDLGTTGNRAIVFDRAGRAMASAYRKFKQYYPKPGLVEQDPEEIWRGVLYVMREAVKRAHIRAAQIAAVGITNQRETTVMWNTRTGKPVYRAIGWQDHRTADECARMKNAGHERMIRQKTGLVLDPYFSATKASWILRRQGLRSAGGLASRYHFGTIDSWILWKLTGGRVHATDVSNASRTMLFNIKTLKWDDELLKLFHIPREILPKVLPSSGEFGALDPSILGVALPITGICGDQHAALFGQACFRPGELKVTYGTGAFLVLNTGVKPVASRKLITTIAWQIGNKVTYALEGSIFSCGAAQNWLQNNLGIIKNGPDADRVAAQVSDCGGVTVVPAFSGLGAPYWDPQARGVILGLTQYSRRVHIVRATLEAIAQQVTDVIEVMRQETHMPIREIRVDGGVAKSDLVLQYQADLAVARVLRARQSESTALGVAMLAGLAVGFWGDIDGLKKISKITRVFTPITDKNESARDRLRFTNAVAYARLFR